MFIFTLITKGISQLGWQHTGVEKAAHHCADDVLGTRGITSSDEKRGRACQGSRMIAAAKPASAAGGRKPPGTMTTCSGSSPARLMREPCPLRVTEICDYSG